MPAVLVHLGTREYDADLSRFASLDPLLDPSSPQQINGYNYANNSPISLSDPSPAAVRDRCPRDRSGVARHRASAEVWPISCLVQLFARASCTSCGRNR